MAMVSCLAYACYKHGDVIRTGVATATNDHRLGAQEAPPAIISLYTGLGMEEHIKAIMKGGPLEGYKEEKGKLDTGSVACVNLVRNLEDRNRTAPFPFCGNRFEFRAVGSAQNINFPLTMVNTAVAEGMSILSGKIEAGMNLRDAVAEMFELNWDTIFNGNGYSEEWNGPGGEAEQRGLLNLRTSVDAYDTLNSEKNQTLFSTMGVFKPRELEARQEVLYENYVQHILIESNTLIDMMKTGVIPACARDLQGYAGTSLAGRREELYSTVAAKTDTLAQYVQNLPHGGLAVEAKYCCEVILPAMDILRDSCDEAEGECAAALWPFPKYSTLTLSHHSEPPIQG
jgi:glutamine synthetase